MKPKIHNQSTAAPDAAATDEQAYREMITRVAGAMARNQVEAVLPYLAQPFRAEHVAMFVDSNFDKRIDVLIRLMPFVSEDEEFPDFEELALDFAAEVPVAAYEGSSEECDAMLAWMQEALELTGRQRDVIACQRARYRVERLAREVRMDYVRFQEIGSLGEELQEQITTDDSLLLVVNPVVLWSTLETDKFLESAPAEPVDVLYFADDQEVRTTMFEPAGKRCFETLQAHAPCSFATWSLLNNELDTDEVVSFLGLLIRLHLVAIQ